MKNLKELDDILKQLSEIERGLSHEERSEFVEKLDIFLSGVRQTLASENRELEDYYYGGWI